jgi:NAD(P) transhydrogenase subunit beta
MTRETLVAFAYIAASILFIFGLKMLSSARTARRGNLISAVGMLIAIVATLYIRPGIEPRWIVVGCIVGVLIGGLAARLVKMTAMPEMVGLFNGFGGMASLLVAWSDYLHDPAGKELFFTVAIAATVIIGGITFSGSMVAYLKLAERITGRPILFRFQQQINAAILLLAIVLAALFCMDPGGSHALLIILILVALVLGVLAVIPIGGADMPVVIALLNSYSGMAACAAGFVLLNNVLIVAGCLVGASGLILTSIMCKAMNRSLANVMFAGVGATVAKTEGYKGEANPVSAEDAYLILEAANSVVIVPGYGMAVAQAQHVVRELGELLEKKGAEVKYAIHPVAGRMPGHMNVLLAEANVPYEQLVVPEDVNPIMSTVDVTMVIGANDVVNPAARTDKGSPLYGMPIIDVDKARTCIVLKRSLNPGFAGVDNPLFFGENTRMLFGDAKASISALVSEFKGS